MHAAGKRQCIWTDVHDLAGAGSAYDPARPGAVFRYVFRVVKRTIDKHGNALLLPRYALEALDDNVAKQVRPYANHRPVLRPCHA